LLRVDFGVGAEVFMACRVLLKFLSLPSFILGVDSDIRKVLFRVDFGVSAEVFMDSTVLLEFL
jgi:hypothetical protein